MTDPEPDRIEQANITAAAIPGFTLAQFAFGELIKNGIVPRGDAEQLLRQAIEAHATAGPGNRAAAKLLTRRSAKPLRIAVANSAIGPGAPRLPIPTQPASRLDLKSFEDKLDARDLWPGCCLCPGRDPLLRSAIKAQRP